MIFEEIGSLFVNVAALSDWRYWVMWAIGGRWSRCGSSAA